VCVRSIARHVDSCITGTTIAGVEAGLAQVIISTVAIAETVMVGSLIHWRSLGSHTHPHKILFREYFS
jgi:hypothetical protein